MRRAIIENIIKKYIAADSATRESIIKYAAEIMPSSELLDLWNFTTQIV